MTKGYLRYALAVIFFANFLSYLDRQVIATMEAELSKPLMHGGIGITATEFGFIGSAFTIGYMVFAPIVGYLITRQRRPLIFALCVLVWSLATVGSGLAPNKWVLYGTRFFIGVGEAGCLVIGPTLLSDYFTKEVRGRVLSIFFLALPLGGACGYIVGAQITKHLNWHWAFFLAGAPGFLVGALIWFLVDPRSSEEPAAPAAWPAAPAAPAEPDGPGAHGHAAPAGVALRDYLGLLSNRTLLFIILAQAFAVMFLQPFMHFGINFFEEERHLPKDKAALTLASIALVAGAMGNALSGFLGDRLAGRLRGAYALMAGVAFCVGMPFMIVGFSSTNIPLACGALGIGAFCYFLCMPAVNTQIANSVSADKRAMAYALAVFILHCLGDTAALPAFGAVSTAVGTKEKAYLIFSGALLLAGLSCFMAARFATRQETPKAPAS
ncbi:MAG TPA: MFS transporter [Planctomycetota bacterium]|nr:MFS transporter [Planctomycetota bacterium]